MDYNKELKINSNIYDVYYNTTVRKMCYRILNELPLEKVESMFNIQVVDYRDNDNKFKHSKDLLNHLKEDDHVLIKSKISI